MSNARIGPGTFFATAVLAILITIGLGEWYSYLTTALGVGGWLGALIGNAVLGAIFFLIRKPIRTASKLGGTPKLAWLPAVLIIFGALSLAIFTKSGGSKSLPVGFSKMIYALATMTVIPVAEEVVFRFTISPVMSRVVGGSWSVWFSAIIFSTAHTNPTWDRFVGFKIGLPLGPFLLAVCCDLIVKKWSKLWPAVLFHSACNATVYLFLAINPSWLEHLSGFYD